VQIVQSCWSCNQKNLLSVNAGWAAPEYHLMSWALSSLQLNSFYKNLTLYADSVSARLLIDKLQLPYTNVVCNLDEINHYNPNLWALPKIHVYAQQEAPFLHIDGDVYVWKKFDEVLLKGKLIAQNKEAATHYYEGIMQSLEAGLVYFPKEITDERKKQNAIAAYNAGIFGGSDISFFKEYTFKAFEFIKKNTSQLHKINVSNFNIFFEQYLFYCLSKKNKKTVSLLLEEIHDDYGYSGFGNFFEVPYERNYIHLLGTFKRNNKICADMAARLRQDFPEYYYRIIQLFYDNKIKLEHDYYEHLPSKSERDLLRRYHLLKTDTLPINSENKTADSSFVFWRTKLVDEYFLKTKKSGVKTPVEKQLVKDVVSFEKKIEKLRASIFSKINPDYLYQRDILKVKYPELIFGGKKVNGDNELVIDKFEIIRSKFNWEILDEDLVLMKMKFQKIMLSNKLWNYFAIVPECSKEGYSFTNVDDLDLYIFSCLKTPISIDKLTKEIAERFDPEELKNAYSEFELLIYGRIKFALRNKLVRSADTC